MLVADDPRAKRKARAKEEAKVLDRRILSSAAMRHISNYFSGLDVPDCVDLYSDRYIEMCLELDTSQAVDAAYKAMRDQSRFQSSCGDGTMGEDIRLVIRLLKGIRAKFVPQEFSAGILLMHLEIVEGIRF